MNLIRIIDQYIYIYKFNNKVRYAFCWNSVFISRLLQLECEYTFEDINDLILLSEDVFINNICKYCIVASYISKNIITSSNFNIYDLADGYVNTLKKDVYLSNNINDDFYEGYKNLLSHTECYK